MYYYCKIPQGTDCLEWVPVSNFIVELSSMTYQDANVLLSQTAALFALAWVWRLLSKQAYRN